MEKFFIQVNPIIIYPPCLKEGEIQDCFKCAIFAKGGCNSTRAMCVRFYKNHKKGCPNYGKKTSCPPNAPMFDKVFDIKKPIYAIFALYDLKKHVEKMKLLHPQWTDRQLTNLLYWQGTARKNLINNINRFNKIFRSQGYYSTIIPEAMGVDITKTLQQVGINLEWPVKTTVYKVALAGVLLNRNYIDILI